MNQKETDWTKKTQAEVFAAYDAINDLRDLMLEANCIGKEWDLTSTMIDRFREALDMIERKRTKKNA